MTGQQARYAVNYAKKKLFALGRLKPGEMNKTEKAYAEELKRQMASGEIVWWRFESIKFRLADNCFFTPDFAIMMPEGEIRIIDVKGNIKYVQDDAKAKIKFAVESFPFRFFMTSPRKKKDGGGWEIKEIGNKSASLK